jgi:CheY-like chemotaxis protein
MAADHPAARRAAQNAPVVLLIDPDEDTRRIYRQWLTLDGWNVEEVDDGRLALAKALALRPDVIITETRLPGITGIDLCQLLRRDSAIHDVSIIVLTADGFVEHIEAARHAGADAVLVKPCRPDHLREELARLIAAKRTPRLESPQRGARGAARTPSATLPAHGSSASLAPAPELVCPQCDHRLTYQRSHSGGVGAYQREQWDYYQCPNGCGTFQYRQRTHKLRKVV